MVDFAMTSVITCLYFIRFNFHKGNAECIYMWQYTPIVQISSNLHDFDWLKFHINMIIYQLFSTQKSYFR
jgi:hypothetical protein